MKKQTVNGQPRVLSINLLNPMQEAAEQKYRDNDVLFLLGTAGTGKSLLASYFALRDLLSKKCKKIIMTRPIVEAGEKLGYLPGDFEAKVSPYMRPIYDALEKLLPEQNQYQEIIKHSVEVAPLAYLRGRTFVNSVCILDEAQNATLNQLKMFLSRFDKGSKLIVTGDPLQSDIKDSALMRVVNVLQDVPRIGVVVFEKSHICRHPLVGEILDKIETLE